jgi:hypothetical protein
MVFLFRLHIVFLTLKKLMTKYPILYIFVTPNIYSKNLNINPMQLLFKKSKGIFSLCFLLFFSLSFLQAQKVTKVKGQVIDADTKEALPFVNIGSLGTTVGTSTDFDGFYELESQWMSDKLIVSYVGYDTDTIDIVLGKRQKINVELKPSSTSLKEVTITAKKRRYRRRGNPAVDFVKRAIKNKEKNRLEGQDYYEYRKYEKIELDINNITDKFRDRKIFNQFQFIFDNVDTSAINGKPYLPIYMQEGNSKIYYRKDPKDKKEYRDAIKVSNFDQLVDDRTVAQLVKLMYQDVDIYQNNIDVVGIQFVSPLSNIAPFYYHFYINDTIEVNNIKCIDLAFQPANKQNFGFKGNIAISLDSNFTVLKVDMGITDQINLNWVTDMRVKQVFSKEGDVWLLSKDQLILDFQITKKGFGFFGRKSTTHTDHIINQPPDENVWSGVQKKIDAEDLFEKDEKYWEDIRPFPLTESEASVYKLVDTLQTIPTVKTALNVINFVSTGYIPVGPVDIGPVNGFYSFNDTEGNRIRFGGETNQKFSPKLRLQGQLLYAFGDQKWKYSTQALYSFNSDLMENPRHHILVRHQHDTNFPGQRLAFINEDNFLLSFKRGRSDRLILFTSTKVEYLRESDSDFSYKLGFEHRRDQPIGALAFNYIEDEVQKTIKAVDVAEFSMNLRWAPNEEFLQGRTYRTNLFNRYPIFKLDYQFGAPNLLGSDYDYHRITLNIFKKFNFSFLGIMHVYLEGGKMFGQVPYNLMFLPRANQTYSYQTFSYNMMNFLEFVSDQYVSFNGLYYMNGYLLNKIPLIRKLKLREVFTFKLLYGKVSDKNNPSIHPELIQFPTDDFGNTLTFNLINEPYMEGSVGIANIFKVLSVDLVQRFNYLDNPNIPVLFGVKGLGIRFRMGLEF